MSTTTSLPAPGDTVSVSDGTVTVTAVSESNVSYDHHSHAAYNVSVESFMDYMGDA